MVPVRSPVSGLRCPKTGPEVSSWTVRRRARSDPRPGARARRNAVVGIWTRVVTGGSASSMARWSGNGSARRRQDRSPRSLSRNHISFSVASISTRGLRRRSARALRRSVPSTVAAQVVGRELDGTMVRVARRYRSVAVTVRPSGPASKRTPPSTAMSGSAVVAVRTCPIAAANTGPLSAATGSVDRVRRESLIRSACRRAASASSLTASTCSSTRRIASSGSASSAFPGHRHIIGLPST
ncbi:hypothetical protein GCWB2_17140 [Gordonia rubripertincta]|nr:hypothetical protein GCWB2_17140 [Gordonia rubripertincta]